MIFVICSIIIAFKTYGFLGLALGGLHLDYYGIVVAFSLNPQSSFFQRYAVFVFQSVVFIPAYEVFLFIIIPKQGYIIQILIAVFIYPNSLNI